MVRLSGPGPFTKASGRSELSVYWTGPDQQSANWSKTIARLAIVYDETV